MDSKRTMWIGAAAILTAAVVPAVVAARQQVPPVLLSLKSEGRVAGVAGTVADSARRAPQTIVLDDVVIIAQRTPRAGPVSRVAPTPSAKPAPL